MLLGYHYMQFYHWAYGINQWLANQGYVVLSINYRSGIGYGRSFRNAPNTGASGNAEYQDVVAGGRYLQSRPDVDPNRVGIWGLSYGGVLTAQALARNSDIFKAGVDSKKILPAKLASFADFMKRYVDYTYLKKAEDSLRGWEPTR